MEEGTNGIIGKRVFLIYEDGHNHYAKKTGVCTFNSNYEIVLDDKILIPKSRIIRIEVRTC